MSTDEFILNYYQKIASNHGDSPCSTMEDQFIRNCEVEFFCKEVEKFITTFEFFPTIMDLGCGNGYLLKVLSLNFPQCSLIGLEYSSELAKIARDRSIENCKIINGDARKSNDFPTKVDILITERSLINILSWPEQQTVLKNISQSLNNIGLYLLSESFKDPWDNLNRARKEVQLDKIEQSKQNLYLLNSLEGNLKKLGFFKQRTQMNEHHLSTHFFSSRIIHQLQRPSGSKIKDGEFTKFLNGCLSPASGQYSPILFQAYQRIYQ